MSEYVPQNAAIAVAAFLGTALLLLVCAIHDRSAARRWGTHAKPAVGHSDRRRWPQLSTVLVASGSGAVRYGIGVDAPAQAR